MRRARHWVRRARHAATSLSQIYSLLQIAATPLTCSSSKTLLAPNPPTHLRMSRTERCLLEAEAVILPGALTIADEVTAGGVKSQSRLGFDPAHIAVVPPVSIYICYHIFNSCDSLLLVQSYPRVDQARRPTIGRPS